MSNYLELLEEKKELGLITTALYKSRVKMYESKGVKQNVKDKYDASAQKKLTLIKEDKISFLTIELINEVKLTNKNTNAIKGWVTFIGIMFVLGLIMAIYSVMQL
ncbi:hypothetical protein SAMN04515667_2310 [Formosa sp. Hel1_31_208]|uniref:hypothetical protein n=1 Tax=Formosa sp. Hel1_31_208 TaxID=1798225 RepID=UPI00087A8BB9|nr:hypothetical protein [Formosa sp. Hel1_31_208]SDS49824.1 hypothetical protein SAMN04515667_2310 [Formosa sp. Hel1_31_208]